MIAPARSGVRLAQIVAVAGVAALLAGVLAGDREGLERMNESIGSSLQYTDYQGAASYIAERHQDGELVIAALTAPAAVEGIPHDDIRFLPGPLSRTRAQRYTRLTDDGVYRDFWLGVPSIVQAEQLCNVLKTNPDAWLIVDASRLRSRSYFAGPMADAIQAMTTVVYEGEKQVQVRRVTSPDSWGPLPEECGGPPA